MNEVKVRAPEDANIRICRGKEAEEADHEIVSVVDLKALLEVHIMHNVGIGRVKFIDWEEENSWRKFLQGETISVKIALEDGPEMFAAVSKSRNPRGIIVHNRESLLAQIGEDRGESARCKGCC